MAKTEAVVKKGKALGADEVIAKTVFGEYRQSRFSNNQIDIGVAWNDYTIDVVLTWKKRVVATQINYFQDMDAKIKKLFNITEAIRKKETLSDNRS